MSNTTVVETHVLAAANEEMVKIKASFQRMEESFGQLDAQTERIEKMLDTLESKLGSVEHRQSKDLYSKRNETDSISVKLDSTDELIKSAKVADDSIQYVTYDNTKPNIADLMTLEPEVIPDYSCSFICTENEVDGGFALGCEVPSLEHSFYALYDELDKCISIVCGNVQLMFSYSEMSRVPLRSQEIHRIVAGDSFLWESLDRPPPVPPDHVLDDALCFRTIPLFENVSKIFSVLSGKESIEKVYPMPPDIYSLATAAKSFAEFREWVDEISLLDIHDHRILRLSTECVPCLVPEIGFVNDSNEVDGWMYYGKNIEKRWSLNSTEVKAYVMTNIWAVSVDGMGIMSLHMMVFDPGIRGNTFMCLEPSSVKQSTSSLLTLKTLPGILRRSYSSLVAIFEIVKHLMRTMTIQSISYPNDGNTISELDAVGELNVTIHCLQLGVTRIESIMWAVTRTHRYDDVEGLMLGDVLKNLKSMISWHQDTKHFEVLVQAQHHGKIYFQQTMQTEQLASSDENMHFCCDLAENRRLDVIEYNLETTLDNGSALFLSSTEICYNGFGKTYKKLMFCSSERCESLSWTETGSSKAMINFLRSVGFSIEPTLLGIQEFVVFSSPRPPEIANLEDKVFRRGKECYVLYLMEVLCKY